MKLELKHLAAYLPYELNVIALKKRYHNFGGVTTEQKKFIIDSLKVNYLSVVGYSGMYLHDDFKPILRPLSDIYSFKYKPRYGNRKYLLTEVMKIEDIAVIECGNINDISHDWFDLLVKYHFDVFGLIKAGLAVDINSL